LRSKISPFLLETNVALLGALGDKLPMVLVGLRTLAVVTVSPRVEAPVKLSDCVSPSVPR
jgi:hypothetical protein